MGTAGTGDFDVIIDDERWAEALGDAEAFAAHCRTATAEIEPRLACGGALLLADDETLRDLNRRFRKQDKATNVLSFPSARPPARPSSGEDNFLGDIAIAFETCAREAKAQGVAFRDHAAHLIVHGLLHLVGYDHEADEEAERMERLETEILARLGVADPYAESEDPLGRF